MCKGRRFSGVAIVIAVVVVDVVAVVVAVIRPVLAVVRAGPRAPRTPGAPAPGVRDAAREAVRGGARGPESVSGLWGASARYLGIPAGPWAGLTVVNLRMIKTPSVLGGLTAVTPISDTARPSPSHRTGPGSCRNFPVSGCRGPEREAGLWHRRRSSRPDPLRVMRRIRQQKSPVSRVSW